MDILKTTPEQLRTKAGQLEAAGGKIKSDTERMISIVDGIGGSVWSGEAATAYQKQFGELRDDSDRMKKVIDDLKEKLTQIAQAYSDVEEEVTSQANSLPDDVFQQ